MANSYATSGVELNTESGSALNLKSSDDSEFTCESTGYNSQRLDSSSKYLFVPKGAMARIRWSKKFQIGIKSDTLTPDYLFNDDQDKLEFMNPGNNQQIYFSVFAVYISKLKNSMKI